MFHRDHLPAHAHVRHGDDEARIAIGTNRILSGSLPSSALRLYRQWARLHRDELMDNWSRAQAHDQLLPIEPLP